MNKKVYVFGSLMLAGIVSAAVGAFMLFPSEGKYKQESLTSLQEKSSDDAMAWLRARYIDVTTGQPVSSEKLAQIDGQIRKMKKSKSIVFESMGPDNIGGRTRAIQPDRSNINRLWAGGVSGGLFVSSNKGNTWDRVESYFAAGGNPFMPMNQTFWGAYFGMFVDKFGIHWMVNFDEEQK